MSESRGRSETGECGYQTLQSEDALNGARRQLARGFRNWERVIDGLYTYSKMGNGPLVVKAYMKEFKAQLQAVGMDLGDYDKAERQFDSLLTKEHQKRSGIIQ